ncbi:MAG: polysaccharide deacetylase family protein [Bdellovibrio sp.]
MNKSILFLLIVLFQFVVQASEATEVSITMDDFNVHEEILIAAPIRNEKILSSLKKHKAKAVLFVVGKYLQSDRDYNLLKDWHLNGHIIANHTFDHKKYDSKVSLEEEKSQILQCENLLNKVAGFQKIFRFPMLAEGDTESKRDQLRTWLKDHGYKNGAVTIDASDWYIDKRLREKIAKDPKADLSPYRDYYLAHMWDRAQYYNNLSKQVLGREVKHTLLIHFNLLNALFLNDLLTMFKSHGWKIIGAADAFKDPVFKNQPETLPSGQSLIWALAKESGKFETELRYPGEDDIYEKPKMDALGL